MSKAFYLKLAASNIKRGKAVYLPQMIATAVIGGVFFLINGLVYSDSLKNLPSGDTARMIFMFGTVLFALFAFFFLFYINGFLIRRRKKEFGLYAVLGLSKGQIGRVLVAENLFSMGLGLIVGIVFALVFGKLLFMLLLRMIRAAGDSAFVIHSGAYLVTLAFFAILFAFSTVYDLIAVRLSNPIELLHSEKKGDKDSKLLVPMAVLGLILLGGAYYFAWSIKNSGIALGVFFPLAALVVIATYLLFAAGSVAVLKMLRKNKRFYYQQEHFVVIGGLIHRMRQNARGLASICILSTMLVVTLSCTLSLYIGQEKMLSRLYPFDVEINKVSSGEADELIARLNQKAEAFGVTLHSDAAKLVSEKDSPADDFGTYLNNVVQDGMTAEQRAGVTVKEKAGQDQVSLVFDAEGREEDCLAFCLAVREEIGHWVSNIFEARQEGYGLYGGLLFLGAFFSILFLCVTVLVIYFKQVAEGYEDKERFEILQKVGMAQEQVKSTIDRQVLFVFFVPVLMTLAHMVFASRIMTQMLRTFGLCDWGLVLGCTGAVCALFVLIYLTVYRMTARTYYKIVRRG